MNKTYRRIIDVLKVANRPLAPHEFGHIAMGNTIDTSPGAINYVPCSGRELIGQSESAIGRRLREMVNLGLVVKNRRAGKSFVEYSLPEVKP